MNILDALILGLVQGLTEFVPISSSGHLILAQKLLGLQPDHLFLEWINLGTVLALIIYFWPRIMEIAREILREKRWTLLRNIIITAIPAGVAGFTLANVIETNSFFNSIWVVVFTLAAVGVVMVLLPKLPKASPVFNAEDLSAKRALGIGLAQTLALIPGTSRSGSTIVAGRLLGLKAAAAAEYSFLVSIPIMLGVTAKLLAKSSDRAYFVHNLTPMIVGNVAALISGLLAVGFLMRYLSRHDLTVFGWYRIAVAVLLAVVLMIQ